MWGGSEIPFKKKLLIISFRTVDLISVHITTAGLDLISPKIFSTFRLQPQQINVQFYQGQHPGRD